MTNTDNCAGTVTAAGAFVITAPQPTVSNTATSPLTYGVSLNQSVSVFGSNFMSGATVTLGTLTGVTVPGTIATATTPYVFVSSTTIRVWWPNTSMPPGSYTAMVTNPAAAGGLTGTLTNAFVVAPPQPTISSVSPASLTYGVSPSQSVSVFGSNFMVGDTVQVDGISCVTVSGTIATATVPCVVVTGSTTTIRFWWNSTSLSPGAQDVTVISPIAAGGLSATLPGALTILPATPAVSSISPTTVTYGITLGSSVTIFGSGFINGAAITVGGLTGTTVPGSVASATVPFVFVSSTQVKFWWPNTSLAPGDYAVTVTNPVASGGLSSTLPAASGFHVVAPQPTVISTTPASVIYGVTANQSVTISGDNFILGAVINVSGLTGTTVAGSIASATTPFVYVSKNTLRFWWSNTSLSLGAHAVQVTNPAVAGGLSATLAGGFTVTAPQPTVTAASPTSVVYGISTSQSITISGSNFVLGSTITVGGLTGTTVTGSIASAATPYVFVNNSTVRFWWPNTSLTTGAYAAQVTNPAAAGGLGATLAAAFTVTGPQPTITSLSLPTATYGVTSSRSVTISGGNFLVGSTITVQGPGGTLSGVTVSGSTATASVPFVWTSSTQVKFWWGNTSLPAGTYDVIVTNPAAGGGLSTTLVGGFVIN
ncbi:MAG: hypothetical protein HY208_00915 [Nitrospirae bacterium]|nr:hypothetical protein [Nitrospirota bacterium]